MFTEIAIIMFDQLPGPYDQAELTHKINHHTPQENEEDSSQFLKYGLFIVTSLERGGKK